MRRKLLTVLFAVALLAACRAKQEITAEVVIVDQPAIVMDPADKAWNRLPKHIAPLLLQDMVEPRLMKASTPEVQVEAMTDGTNVAFRLTWPDETADSTPMLARFPDACAVQLPRKTEPDLPAPQMGEPGRPVEITFWRASWQAVVDGKRSDTIRDIYPNAAVDHYPFEAPSLPKGSVEQRETALRYAPARALGNMMAGPRQRPVETLVAEGPGTLSPDPVLRADGRGVHDAKTKQWHVVMVRALPDVLRATGRSQAAFAVWQGSQQEAGARKMRTGWVPVLRRGRKS